ncbi:MAG TPA: tyrosine-type recombinase/integrase [Candidatus Copromorpha excrementigallinarum]|uniref:Tyrosine-type recombinase/integrase n=1 Tax=Candidatus Allocopromorpha excrementigallinarum TaxID=2840742 RepID=A0A9D1HZP7_9FIRM|nr:tyrosine-type recombinase/integrase [Candidatus Copromorpha excrementigallinarum]
MAGEKNIKLHNKSDKPDNIVMKEHETEEKCQEIEDTLPSFLRGFFTYLKGSVLPMTRLSYLGDIKFFCQYLVNETDLTEAEKISDIKLEDFNKIKAADINLFIEYCRRYRVEKEKETVIYENGSRSLARKKSSLSVMFRQLYRSELLSRNITDGFDPIRVPKAGEREIKALQDDEVMIMLDAVSTGEHLTEKERQYWEKTKRRDKAILMLFLTYGLRLTELYQLNVSSFNFSRGEFKIYRKRDKEAVMPLNISAEEAVRDYLENERDEKKALNGPDEDALFLSLQGRRMTERQIRQLVKKYTSIGLSTSRKGGYSPHKLRATAATSLIGRGNSIYDVQALLDHEQVTTTQLYAGHRMNVKRDLVKDMEWELERKEKE